MRFSLALRPPHTNASLLDVSGSKRREISFCVWCTEVVARFRCDRNGLGFLALQSYTAVVHLVTYLTFPASYISQIENDGRPFRPEQRFISFPLKKVER